MLLQAHCIEKGDRYSIVAEISFLNVKQSLQRVPGSRNAFAWWFQIANQVPLLMVPFRQNSLINQVDNSTSQPAMMISLFQQSKYWACVSKC